MFFITNEPKKIANRAVVFKMDFLGIVSHELKSPLTSLSGYIQILQSRSRKLQDESFANLLGSAARQNARMRGLIEGFLDVARIGEGKLSLKLVSFDTAVLLRNIQQTYQETIDSHSLQFSDLASINLEADQDKIEQVIVNLVNNAIKYSPSGTTITIEARNADDHFCIRVADQGPGISVENQQKLFSRFFRIENEQTELVSGFGIGLYICREIISLHGGEIGIESELGNGSTFFFKLPITKKEQSVVA
ncbi:sensor histidine kinase [Sphingobacterium deserti]|uniref:histidine kinase n=1 Tax=Sphingobacterium deserti TaxID=1229276 RepID=A0A0B8T576_9SPHI|nr:HAMP domain-containing sensor histidine kinase [Sphingobacterium deserti]KGE12624.1 PAS sensor protein [Sphingobacterium deserti]